MNSITGIGGRQKDLCLLHRQVDGFLTHVRPFLGRWKVSRCSASLDPGFPRKERLVIHRLV